MKHFSWVALICLALAASGCKKDVQPAGTEHEANQEKTAADVKPAALDCIRKNEKISVEAPYAVMPDMDCMKSIRDSGGDIHAADAQGNTVFSELFKQGYYSFGDLIDPKVDYKSMFPHVMVRLKGDSKVVEDAYRNNPLLPESEAAKAELDALEKLLPALIDAGLNVKEQDEQNNTYLFFVSSFEAATALIKAGLDVDAKNKDGETALNHATVYRRLGAFEALIEAGADVNTKDNAGIAPLVKHLGVVEGFDNLLDNHHSFAVPDMLLKKGADVNARDNNGGTLLFYEYDSESDGSDKFNSEDILKTLTGLGIDVNAQDKNGRTALMVARDCDLLNYGADPGIQDNDGRNAAFYNIYCFFNADGKSLNDHAKKYNIKQLVNTADKNGVTPIMAAAGSDVSYYIKAGSNVNAKDGAGKTVLGYHSDDSEAVKLLKAAGAK